MFAASAVARSQLTRIMEFLLPSITRSFVVVLLLASVAQSAPAQGIDADGKSAIAVADSVLAALSRGDNATLARLTLDSSVVGGAGLRDGVERLSLRTWGLYINRTGPATFTERGFDAASTRRPACRTAWLRSGCRTTSTSATSGRIAAWTASL